MVEPPSRTEAEREAARRARMERRAKGSDPEQAPAPSAERGAPRSFRVPSAARSAPRTPRQPRRPRPPRGPRTPRAPRRPRGGTPSRGRFARIAALLALVGLALVVVAIWFLVSLFQPFGGSGHGRVVVDIPRGASTGQVGSILARDGVISSGFFFKLRVKLDGDTGKLLPGKHVMAHGMSYSAALTVLTTPPPAAPTTNVTIIPGESRWQIDRLLHREGVPGSYLAATRRSPLLKLAQYGAPASTPSLEGFLFPDTYQLRKPINLKALVADQLTAFKQQFAKVNLRYARSKNLTAYDVLKIASLAAAEAAAPSDLPKVTSVIYNRLRDGMELGFDTTVAYIFHNYTGGLTVSELDSSSPWNTTKHPGLPPTPIDSPSLSAIEAAAHPAATDYLYFIVKVCGNGRLFFTNSYEAFLRASQQYNAAVSKRGIEHAEFCK